MTQDVETLGRYIYFFPQNENNGVIAVLKTAVLVLLVIDCDYFREHMRLTCTFLAAWNEESDT